MNKYELFLRANVKEKISLYKHGFFNMKENTNPEEMEMVRGAIDYLKWSNIYVSSDSLYKELVWESDVKKQNPTKEFFGDNVIARRNTL